MKSEGFKIIGTVYTQPVLFIYITHLASVSLVFTVTSRPFPSIMQHAPSSSGEAQDGSSGMHSSWECLGMSFSLGFPEAQKVNNGEADRELKWHDISLIIHEEKCWI